jgi:hypothetical protein
MATFSARSWQHLWHATFRWLILNEKTPLFGTRDLCVVNVDLRHANGRGNKVQVLVCFLNLKLCPCLQQEQALIDVVGRRCTRTQRKPNGDGAEIHG